MSSLNLKPFGCQPTSSSKPLITALLDYKLTLICTVSFSYLALLCVDLFEVEPAFPLHIAVADAAQLRGRVSFRASLFSRTQTVQGLNHDTEKHTNVTLT